jgi:hypothetical protein
MSTKARVAPFSNAEFKVEENKSPFDRDDDADNRMAKNRGGINYEEFKKKQHENRAQLRGKGDALAKIEPKVNNSGSSASPPIRDRLHGGTGGQDHNISIKSETSITTKVGGDDYLNDNVIEDVRVGNQLLNQLKISEIISTYFALTTICAGIVEYELGSTYEQTSLVDGIRDSLLSICSVASLL